MQKPSKSDLFREQFVTSFVAELEVRGVHVRKEDGVVLCVIQFTESRVRDLQIPDPLALRQLERIDVKYSSGPWISSM